EANRKVRMLQIGPKLRKVNGKQAIDCFQLEKYLAFHDDVSAIGCADQRTIEGDRDWHFALDGKAIPSQSMDHASPVRAFEQSGSQSSVHIECAGEDALRNFLVNR